MAKGNTKKVEVEVPEVFSAHLAAFLHNNPHVTAVWVNEKGEYSLKAKAGYDKYAVDDHLKSLEEYQAPAVAGLADTGQIEQLQKEIEDLKAENAYLKDELAKASANTGSGEPKTQQ